MLIICVLPKQIYYCCLVLLCGNEVCALTALSNLINIFLNVGGRKNLLYHLSNRLIMPFFSPIYPKRKKKLLAWFGTMFFFIYDAKKILPILISFNELKRTGQRKRSLRMHEDYASALVHLYFIM